MERLVITPREAAKALKISLHRIYEILEAGEIKAYREGTYWKIPVASLNEYINEMIGRRAS